MRRDENELDLNGIQLAITSTLTNVDYLLYLIDFIIHIHSNYLHYTTRFLLRRFI